MVWCRVREGFHVAENFFPLEGARALLWEILRAGEDPLKGFTHPPLRPNRFHERPNYPVKRYMCYGLYWNPQDYLYHETLPGGVAPWPIPTWMQELGQRVVKELFPDQGHEWRAETALVNLYTSDSRLGLHVDRDEEDLVSPVVGLSFGGTCRFQYEDEDGVIQSLRLPGNSVYAFGGRARLMRHGVPNVYHGSLGFESAGLLQEKERLSVTLRRVKVGL